MEDLKGECKTRDAYVFIKLRFQGYKKDFEKKLIENGIITTSQSKYFGTQVSIAMLFEKRKECLELLKKESIDEKKSQFVERCFMEFQ